MRRTILVILSIITCWLGRTTFAFGATRVVSQETALIAYMEALQAGNFSRAAEMDCWGYNPAQMIGVESWSLKNTTDNIWQVGIEFAADGAEPVQSEWKFEAVSTLSYRTEIGKVLDGSLNLWAQRANKLAKAVGIDLKKPTPLKPEDLISVSKEPFCIASHSKISNEK